MSKTLNNTILIKDIIKNNNEEYLSYFILSTNYKKISRENHKLGEIIAYLI